MSDLVFEFDAFARRHLREWFRFGMAPNDWTADDLDAFTDWVEAHAAEFRYDAGWSTLARRFDDERGYPL